jgi:hypothetical protein
MKLKLFMETNPGEIELQINSWLESGKIEILKTEMTMQSIAEKPNDGTHPCIVIAVWYIEKANYSPPGFSLTA